MAKFVGKSRIPTPVPARTTGSVLRHVAISPYAAAELDSQMQERFTRQMKMLNESASAAVAAIQEKRAGFSTTTPPTRA